MAQDRPTAKPSPAQVRAQRDKILASKLFALSKRQKSFLEFIVNAELDGKSDKLKEFALGIDVFERDESFDPNIDSIVRVEASRLRSKLRDYFSGEGQNDPVIISVPKGHYVPAFRFNTTDQQISANDANGLVTRRQLGLTVIGIVALAALFFVVDNYVLDRSPANSVVAVNEKSIAVLPFLSLSSGPDDEYFADGLAEEILNSLAQLPELKVTARTSSFYFKGQSLLVTDIASRLGVAHVVEGSVRREGDRLRIAVQLVRAADEFHVWSQTYDRTRDDIFAVQQEIAEHIAEVLGVVLDDAARETLRSSGIHDVNAFIAFQKGQEAFANAHQGMNMSDALMAANSHFDRALQSEPGLTTARLMKADLRGHVLFEIAAGIREQDDPSELQETLIALREEYRLAVELSPAGQQRDLLEIERTLFSEDWTSLPARIGKSMQADGCAQMAWTNAFISPFGWATHLSTKNREAVACSPLDTVAYFLLASSLIWSGDSNAALLALEEAEKKGLSHPFLDDGRFWALLATGRTSDPDTMGPGPQGGNMPYDRQILREALTGDLATARQMANDYWSSSETNDFSSLVIAAVIGDRARANEAANRIDAYPGSAVAISTAIFTCYCGAPFDLESTPNFKARIDEAGFPWPPPKLIDYPAKTW